MPRTVAAVSFTIALVVVPAVAKGQDLVVDGTTITLGGIRRYASVRVVNGGRIVVPPFDGVDRVNTGNLVLIAPTIVVDARSSIDARGAGYQTPRCGNGRGPTPTAGGVGGCAVFDSGGGGAHFGRGGRGTKDCFIYGSRSMCEFPQEYEEDCGNSLMGGMCSVRTDCRDLDGLPSVAGQPYLHSIYEIEFGASGGDKGCRDGDGFGAQPMVGGAGGGRIVLAAITPTGTGSITIDGTISAAGRRGCGTGNDSGGGGAGGTILIVGDRVTVGPTAVVTAAGGLGGDTFAAAVGQPDYTDCPPGAQTGGTCDDCGGGGGGGIVQIVSRSSSLDHRARFDVAGAAGGVCPICRGEAGGGAGELLLDGAYVGEFCDGYDNDFDGSIDEALGTVRCGLGACARDIPACSDGRPVTCEPTVGPDPSCRATDAGSRPRIAVILDTSSSMLLDLRGYPTFGDGSVERPGLDTDGNGRPDDSRLFLAREALANVISAYPEIDFALARYHQDQGLRRSCQIAKWFECQGLIASYDNPTDNTGTLICNVEIGPGRTVPVREISTAGDECINYAGSCGPPRRGADILAGFGTPTRDLVRWLDGRETAFSPDMTPGDVCGHARFGNDCEVRASGETPLANALQAVEDYLVPIRATDPSSGCRTYAIILVTDGAESCGGDPVAQAARLYDRYGIQTYVIAVSVLPSEEASLNAIAQAGSGGARTTATFVRNPGDLVPALSAILEGSIRTERCNGVDDDCDGRVDEGFPLGMSCDDGRRGACRGTGTTVCAPSGLGVECRITMPGSDPLPEICNALDDDCDEAIDEGLVCSGICTPTGAEVCNGLDDDCNGAVDEVDPAMGRACGESMGECSPGMIRCVAGSLACIGGRGPRDEVCNGLDDDCDGVSDDLAVCPAGSLCIASSCRRSCDPGVEFPCPVGFDCVEPPGVSGHYCLESGCSACAPGERCIDGRCIDPCEGIRCPPGEQCRGGECFGCAVLGCPEGEVCIGGTCRPDRCAGVRCEPNEMCVDGSCVPACGAGDCPPGERCGSTGRCEPDPCAGASCGAGQTCVEGSCRTNPCADMDCGPGQVCAPSLGCIDDPCLLVRCPEGRRCSVDSTGRAGCDRPAVGLDGGVGHRVIALGGGGCACRVTGGATGRSGWAAAVLFVLFGIVAGARLGWRRR